MARKLLGKVVAVRWDDAFDSAEEHPTRLKDEYVWTTYGRVIRETDKFITVATSEGGEGEDERVYATTILRCMVLKVQVLTP